MSTPFSPATERLLRRSGWFAERRVDPSRWVAALEQDGYRVHAAARDVLARFGGLRVVFPHRRVEDADGDVLFDPIAAIGAIWPERVEVYASRAGESLCLVGEAFRGHMSLLAAPSGRILAGTDDVLVEVGRHMDDALEALCSGVELPAVD